MDEAGYRWFRIDDYGMGMSETIINNYLLKVGNSYYLSDEFKIRKLEYKEKDNVDFTPISRFGIGILSCFIVGDHIEINTRSHECNGKTIFLYDCH
jgi:HSP90 family molecular chaperone